MIILFLIPSVTFFILLLGESFLPTITQKHVYHRWDWTLNIIGLIMQGLVIPFSAYFLSTKVFPTLYPTGKGILPLTWIGGFILGFVGIDFLYYWQHRVFHQWPFAWGWHRCHHASPRVDIWATARNSILTNFLFVYMLINPIPGYLCKNPDGFFAGVILTASLDLVRHSRIDFKQIPGIRTLTYVLGRVLISPDLHHRHHHALEQAANFGANLVIWDVIFNTYCSTHTSKEYRDPNSPHPLRQLLHPFM